jgi:hypothetical protein
MAVMKGTGGTAKRRVTCTGVVRQGWSSQPGGGLGGSAGDGPGEDFAAGDAGAPGDLAVPGDVDAAGDAGAPGEVPGDVAGAGADGDADGDP